MKLKTRAKIAMAAALLTPMAIPSPAAAEGLAGCRSKYRLEGDPWSEDTYFLVPTGDNVGRAYVPRVVDIRLHRTLGFWHCPNGKGDHNDKIKGVWLDLCWFMPGTKEDNDHPEHYFFTGVTFKGISLYDDSGANYTFPDFKVGDDNTRQNCATQNLPADREFWQYVEDEPRGKARYTINLRYLPDDDGQFETASGGTVRHVYPGNWPLSEWYEGPN